MTTEGGRGKRMIGVVSGIPSRLREGSGVDQCAAAERPTPAPPASGRGAVAQVGGSGSTHCVTSPSPTSVFAATEPSTRGPCLAGGQSILSGWLAVSVGCAKDGIRPEPAERLAAACNAALPAIASTRCICENDIRSHGEAKVNDYRN